MKKGTVFGSYFGKDKIREGKIKRAFEKGGLRPIDNIKEYFAESSCIRRGHFFGYRGDVNDFENTRILIGLCCEGQGPSLALYPSMEAAYAIKKMKGSKVRAIIPTYEFCRLGIYSEENAMEIGAKTRRILEPLGFEVIDTINNKDYLLSRLDMGFRIQKYLGVESRDPIGSDSVGMQMANMQIADTLLSLEDMDTLLIADQGSAIPSSGVRRVSKKIGLRKNYGELFYVEPLGLDAAEIMYRSSDKRKIYLLLGEEGKIMQAVTSGGASIEEFQRNGGRYHECIVGEIESLVAADDNSIKESCSRCKKGEFLKGCAEHKEIVKERLKEFLEAFR